MTIPAWAISANSLTAETFRQGPSSLLAGAGVVGSGDYAVAQHSSGNMSVDVAAGQAWVPGTLASTAGFPANLTAQTGYGLPSTFNEQASYYGWSSGTTNLTISASNPSNPRIDLVVLAVQDAEYSGSNNQMVLQVITGTPAASPSPPSPPSSSIVLAQVAVGAGVTQILTANITDERPAAGAIRQITPQCRVYRNGAYTDANSAFTLAPFDTVNWDTFSAFSTSTHLYTVPVAGYYNVMGAWSRATSLSAGQAMISAIYQNGSAVSWGSYSQWTATGARMTSTVADHVKCAVGDTLALYYFDYGGGGANTLTTACYMSIGKESS